MTTDTSREAFAVLEPVIGRLQTKVYEYLKTTLGATDSEMQSALNMHGNTQRPRRCELIEMGLVKDSGHRRRNVRGRSEIVWVIA